MTFIRLKGFVMIRWIILILIMSICGVLVAWSSPILDEDWRADWQPLRYVAVVDGALYDCPSDDCLQLTQFYEGTMFTVIGAVGRDGVMWYVVAVEDDEAYVRIHALAYYSAVDTTPVRFPVDGGRY
jgi:hypothetical protein